MRIAIATVQVPFTRGGGEIHAEMLRDELIKRGHVVDIVTIPFKWYPWESLVDSMNMGRSIDLSEANGEKIDLVIATKFPAYYIKHENKVLWLLHQHRQAYDMWGTDYSDIEKWKNGNEIRELIRTCDCKYISEAKKVFTIANNTTNRLRKFNNIESRVLYHPPINSEKLYSSEYRDYVFYPSRINQIKRQRLLVEAAKFLKTDAKIYIAGSGIEAEMAYLVEYVKANDLEKKVRFLGFISEEEKRNYYANSLVTYFGAYDEDYGYITLEAMLSEKAVIVHNDAGGPLEFVDDGINGFVIEPNPQIIAEKIDYLFLNRDVAKSMGQMARKSLIDKHMDWDYVIDQLISE